MEQDKRVERSRRLLMSSLLALMVEEPYSKISVARICQHSGVARPTFYLHFHGKDDLLRGYIGNMFADFYQQIDPYLTRSLDADPMIATLMFRQWSDNSEFSRVLLQADVEALILTEFSRYVRRIIERFVTVHQLPLKHSGQLDYVIDFLTGASFMVIARWIREDFPITAEEMGELYADLIRPGLLNVLLAGKL
ncbi:hypothetical protein CHH28_07840 [Bacterioplanes sanyensis]|uniref:HTH tetR-type domain-containing protein n=1 Tax=Bacterioplanes sanyensis TaxID=1249553 RepID=A0A222FJJ4_9GAMM|nr:TetR/AcrR family transcriptional regulator [Bacterioplanes sanyensis]ASP38591.1 hypothetical protein CHH28_07840 [Bacterioplanes sanyensis]